MKKSVAVLAMVAMMAGLGFAQDEVTPNLNAGTKVIEGSGYIDGDTPLGTDYNVELGFGYFFIDNLEVGLLGGYRDNDEFSLYNFGVRAEYNIDLDMPLVPFVGVAGLWAGAEADRSDRDEDTAVARVSAGVKYFIDDNVALTFSAVWDKAADDIYFDEDGDAQDDNFKGLFGIRFYFD